MDKNYAEAIASLREMVSIYGEEGERGGVLVPYEEQPTCIRRAMDAINEYDKQGKG